MRLVDVRARLDPFPTRLPGIPSEVIPEAFGPAGERIVRAPGFDGLERRPAAVLILIYPDAIGAANIVLIERSAGDHRHAGQISLPGGAIDVADASPIEAALREAREEVNLDAAQADVQVAGMLPVFDVRVSGFLVYPVVAFAERVPTLAPDGFEVAEIIHAPLAAFLPGAAIERTAEAIDGFQLRYGGYRIGRHLVWGATAMMLGRFGAYLGADSA